MTDERVADHGGGGAAAPRDDATGRGPGGGATPAAAGDQGPREDAGGVAERIWRGVRALVVDDNDRRKEVSAALGLSFVRVKALIVVAGGPVTLRTLADRLVTDAPYTSVVVADLERRGLVERAAHLGDRRVKVVTITPEGAAAAGRAERLLNRPPASLLALDPADLACLDRIVTAVRRGASPDQAG
ncbi:MarR family winged helix-turn-helix transcriptional regulator [Microbispora sp. NPDC049125]|uniref:MarR family winged helix-turn-helix transcriptional regulator n=1 Tax=Microbispora sp. NPDC049125 TaxID=3154929 RepID=UPI003465CBC4